MGALVMLLAVFASACGGGGRLSAREYAHEASRICREASRRVDRATGLGRKAEALSSAASDLADLHPPGSMARFDTQWVALVRQSAAELDALVAARRAGDHESATQRRDAVVTLTTRAAELAAAQGIAACPTPFGRAGGGTVETRT